VDLESNAKVQSNKYKIAIKDVCGFVTQQSSEHKSLHLTINQGVGNNWNLIWEPYFGVPISSYKIYRGTKKSNLTEIASTSGSNTTFTDVTAPKGNLYYQIYGVLTYPCTMLKSNQFSSVQSNIISNSNDSEGIINENDFLYPNPASNKISLKTEFSADAVIMIYNSHGKLISTVYATKEIDISTLSKGLYFIKLNDSGKILVTKMIKN
jgi:hypothetical protein